MSSFSKRYKNKTKNYIESVYTVFTLQLLAVTYLVVPLQQDSKNL